MKYHHRQLLLIVHILSFLACSPSYPSSSGEYESLQSSVSAHTQQQSPNSLLRQPIIISQSPEFPPQPTQICNFFTKKRNRSPSSSSNFLANKKAVHASSLSRDSDYPVDELILAYDQQNWELISRVSNLDIRSVDFTSISLEIRTLINFVIYRWKNLTVHLETLKTAVESEYLSLIKLVIHVLKSDSVPNSEDILFDGIKISVDFEKKRSLNCILEDTKEFSDHAREIYQEAIHLVSKKKDASMMTIILENAFKNEDFIDLEYIFTNTFMKCARYGAIDVLRQVVFVWKEHCHFIISSIANKKSPHNLNQECQSLSLDEKKSSNPMVTTDNPFINLDSDPGRPGTVGGTTSENQLTTTTGRNEVSFFRAETRTPFTSLVNLPESSLTSVFLNADSMPENRTVLSDITNETIVQATNTENNTGRFQADTVLTRRVFLNANQNSALQNNINDPSAELQLGSWLPEVRNNVPIPLPNAITSRIAHGSILSDSSEDEENLQEGLYLDQNYEEESFDSQETLPLVLYERHEQASLSTMTEEEGESVPIAIEAQQPEADPLRNIVVNIEEGINLACSEASRKDHFMIIQYLVDEFLERSDPIVRFNISTGIGDALGQASKSGHLEFIKYYFDVAERHSLKIVEGINWGIILASKRNQPSVLKLINEKIMGMRISVLKGLRSGVVFAASRGHSEALTTLLECARLRRVKLLENLNMALWQAATKSHVPCVNIIISYSQILNTDIKNGINRAICLTSRKGMLSMMVHLIKTARTTGLPIGRGIESAMGSAAFSNQIECLKYLLQNLPSQKGINIAIANASSVGNLECLNIIFDATIDRLRTLPNLLTSVEPALICASRNGHANILQELVMRLSTQLDNHAVTMETVAQALKAAASAGHWSSLGILANAGFLDKQRIAEVINEVFPNPTIEISNLQRPTVYLAILDFLNNEVEGYSDSERENEEQNEENRESENLIPSTDSIQSSGHEIVPSNLSNPDGSVDGQFEANFSHENINSNEAPLEDTPLDHFLKILINDATLTWDIIKAYILLAMKSAAGMGNLEILLRMFVKLVGLNDYFDPWENYQSLPNDLVITWDVDESCSSFLLDNITTLKLLQSHSEAANNFNSAIVWKTVETALLRRIGTLSQVDQQQMKDSRAIRYQNCILRVVNHMEYYGWTEYRIRRMIRPLNNPRPHDSSDGKCTICYSNLWNSIDGPDQFDCVLELNCMAKDLFHESCLTQWLRTHSTCPNCRAGFSNHMGRSSRSSL